MSTYHGHVAYGKDANCTLEVCPINASIYGYRPSLAANSAFIALFGICFVLHSVQSIYWRSWGFLAAMGLGCIDEMIGYGGRIMLYENPFSFTGFLIQIICITTAPVFFCAAIYVLLAQIFVRLGSEHSRFSPKLFYWIFIPCDIVSLVLQAAGGALSSTSHGKSKIGVDIALAGLSFQVFTLASFIGLCLDYILRYQHSSTRATLTKSFKIFAVFLFLAIVLILIRCAYRIDELSDGYSGPLIHNESLFIALEGVMVIVAAFSMSVAHPGMIFSRNPGENHLTRGTFDMNTKEADKTSILDTGA